MKVSVKFFSYIKFETGLDEIEITLEEGATIEDMVDSLESQYGERLIRFIKNREKGKYISLFIINNRQCDPSQSLINNEVVLIMPTVAGG